MLSHPQRNIGGAFTLMNALTIVIVTPESWHHSLRAAVRWQANLRVDFRGREQGKRQTFAFRQEHRLYPQLAETHLLSIHRSSVLLPLEWLSVRPDGEYTLEIWRWQCEELAIHTECHPTEVSVL